MTGPYRFCTSCHIPCLIQASAQCRFKVEKILKGSLDSTPLASVRIQTMGGKVCLRCKGKTLLGVVNQLLRTKKFVDITQQCFDLLPQANFAVNNLNFHRRQR